VRTGAQPGMLIFFRVLQGIGGGGLQPSEQAILADTFPASKRGMAFAVYGMAVVVAPAIGPTLGGWITDNFTWRWIFYINVPIGLISLFLTNRLVEDPPFLKREQERRRNIRADYVGLGLITLAIASLQIALDKGRSQIGFRLRGSRVFSSWPPMPSWSGLFGSGTIRTLSWTSIYSRSAISRRRCSSALRWDSPCTARRS